MENPCKVSVIIAVYGVERFIERCARSLFEQTLDDMEFLFIDDCTPDRSIEILKQVMEDYSSRKSQVVIHKMERNSGQAVVRQWGMQNAKGEYVIHCDSDDWVSPCIYQKMYEKAKNEGSDIVSCDYYLSDGIKSKPVRQLQTEGLLTGPLWNRLVRRSLIKENEIIYPRYNKAEDGAIMVQLSYYARSFSVVHEPLYYYYQNPDSICHVMTEEAMMKRLNEEICNTNLRIDFIEKQGDSQKYKYDVLIWKKTCRNNLTPFLYKQKFRKMWRNLYPEINKQYILASSISIKSKIKFILNYLGVRV